MSIWKNLGEEKAKELYKGLLNKGYTHEQAFDEVYSIECNLDTEDF